MMRILRKTDPHHTSAPIGAEVIFRIYFRHRFCGAWNVDSMHPSLLRVNKEYTLCDLCASNDSR